MANTPDEIFRIHTRNLATPGKKYFRDDGSVFIGIQTGRLKIIDKADNTSIDPGNNFESNTVQGGLDELSENLSSLETTVGILERNVIQQRISLQVDCTTLGTSNAYTVELGSKFVVAQTYAIVDRIGGAGMGLDFYPVLSIGKSTNNDDIYQPVRLITLDQVDDMWNFNTTGKNNVVNGGEIIKVEVKEASTADLYIIKLHIYGSFI